MSDDLVKRLRSIDDDQICTGCYTIVEAADEAADLIEKLVAAMKEIVSLYKGEEIDDSVYARDNAFTMNDKIEQIVSKALEGKDD
jgi:N-dimethylarginine dimethylaminohydrolase